jgi:hypothetical protein
MPSADQVPVKSAFDGTCGLSRSPDRPALHYVLFALPTFTSRRVSGAISFSRERDGFFVAFAPGHHSPGHSRNLVGERDSRNLGRPPRQQRREPGSVPGAMDLGIADDRERASHEQAAQIAISLFADTAEPVPCLHSSTASEPARSRQRSYVLTGRRWDPQHWRPERSPVSDLPRECNEGVFARLVGPMPLLPSPVSVVMSTVVKPGHRPASEIIHEIK